MKKITPASITGAPKAAGNRCRLAAAKICSPFNGVFAGDFFGLDLFVLFFSSTPRRLAHSQSAPVATVALSRRHFYRRCWFLI